eukprot:UN26859
MSHGTPTEQPVKIFQYTGYDCKISYNSNGECVSTRLYPLSNYDNNEYCKIYVEQDVEVVVTYKSVESCCDRLTYTWGTPMYYGSTYNLGPGDYIEWTSDYSVNSN